jgi:BsuBI/PstI restriction endonuclease domain/BsuBI/PstI restriction endonuclease HTH domain
VSTRAAARLVAEARDVLSQLGFDGPQSNERSALTLLALLRMKPKMAWEDAERGLHGVTPLMGWMAQHFGKVYAPNSRETIRRQTLHQFVEAALVVQNSDDPARAINSGKNVYQVDKHAHDLLRCFGSEQWPERLAEYLLLRPGLQVSYAAARQQEMIEVVLPDGVEVRLSPGGQNDLIKLVIEQFCGRWTPGGRVLYVGDAGGSDPLYDERSLVLLGVNLDRHGKFPDLIVHLPDRNWLVLMEAASSHGPVDSKRHAELQRLFGSSTAGLVFVSCFPSRSEMRRYLREIAWETEVWCADAPSHLIHFNGERFLGPHAPTP